MATIGNAITIAMEKLNVTRSITEATRELGYPIMKPEQLDITVAFVEGRDVFSVLPTGYGKSLCYSCLPYTFDKLANKERGFSIVVVVTPLVVIMKDQVSICRF